MNFDIKKIERMQVNVKPCSACKGWGIIEQANKLHRCGKCHGTGEQIKTGGKDGKSKEH